MRDPFESSPALRLGDAKAKPREAPVEPRPPSLAPEFGDAFGAAFSKPSRETVAALLGNVAYETRRPVGDGAMRYEPRGFAEIRPEVLSEAEFKRRQESQYVETLSAAIDIPVGDLREIVRRNYGPMFPIDHGDTSPAALLHNHAALVAKKDAEK